MNQDIKTIFYFTDTHLHEDSPGEHGADAAKNFNEILTELRLRNPDVVVFGGDIGLFSAYPEFFEALKDYPDLYVTPGNHDTSAHVRLFFSREFESSESGFYRQYENEQFQLLFLDSSTDQISAEQIEWLGVQIASSNKPMLLFVHHPILPVNSAVDKKYPLKNREVIKDLLLESRRQVTICCGHYHTEDETCEVNIRQFVTPAVSYQIKKDTVEIESDASYLAYRMLYLDGANLETEVIKLYPDDF